MLQLILREEFFTPSDKDTLLKKQNPTIRPSEMQLNANVDGTGPGVDTEGMEYKQNNERLCDEKIYLLLSKSTYNPKDI